MELRKGGQQEMVGFILIVILVMIGLMVFLVISVRDSPSDENSVEVDNMLQALMRHVTDCAIVYEPQYDDFEDLFKSCYSGDRCSNLGMSACEYLNESLISVVGDMMASEAAISAYSIEFSSKNDGGMSGILRVSEGNCTGISRGAQRSIASSSDILVVRAKICY